MVYDAIPRFHIDAKKAKTLKKSPSKKSRYIIKKTIRYRNSKTGRFQKRNSKYAIVEEIETQYTEAGKMLRQRRAYRKGASVNVPVPPDVDGMINRSLNRKGWLSQKHYKNVKNLLIKINGTDYREKEYRIKALIDLDKGEWKISDTITGRIIGLLHERRLRTQYDVETVNWSICKTSKSFAKKCKQLHDVSIYIEVRR